MLVRACDVRLPVRLTVDDLDEVIRARLHAAEVARHKSERLPTPDCFRYFSFDSLS